MFEKVDNYTMKTAVITNKVIFYNLSELQAKLVVLKKRKEGVEDLIKEAEKLGLIPNEDPI